jgi:predicted permease
MPILLTVTLPLFALILAGYVMAWRGLIDRAGIGGLTGFVYYVALPLLLFDLFAHAPVAEQFDGRYVLAYMTVGVAVHLGGLATARWLFKCTWPEQVVQGNAVSFGNTVFIALPVTIGLFGDGATLPMLLVITVENGVLMPLTVVLLELGRAGGDGIGRAAMAALTSVLRNPIVMPVLAGAVVALAGIDFPAIVDGIIGLVRGATVPCALFALGATLAGLPLTERLRETGFMVVTKLFVFPALVYLAMRVMLPDLDPAWRYTAVIAAAAPTGANVYLIASRYDAYVNRASTAILASTALSVVTISALVVVLG